MFDQQNLLELDRHHDVIFYPWNDVGNDLAAESASIAFNNGGIDIRTKSDGLANVNGNLFIMGHGNYQPIAAGGGARGLDSMGAHKLARIIQEAGLPLNFAHNIVVWTCWGGVPGGLAQSLFLALKNRAYTNLRVWGCMEATGTFAHEQAAVHRGLKMGVINDTDLLPFGQSQVQGMGAVGLAARADMRCYS